LAVLLAGDATVDAQATFSQQVSRTGSKTRDKFMINSFLCDALGFAMQF
jgi:hypothetical protein